MLNEPNGSDTYYSLYILNILKEKLDDERSIKYLKNMQKMDGTYSSIYSAYYSINGLHILNKKPNYNPVPYITNSLKSYRLDIQNINAITVLRQLYYFMDLLNLFDITPDHTTKESIIDFIMGLKRDDGGFGNKKSTLTNTFYAASILEYLRYTAELAEIEDFVSRCEDRIYGFVNIPYTYPSFIEHIHAGIALSNLTNHKIKYKEKCIDFIVKSQNSNGGFARSPSGGISTLENTFLAIKSLYMLSL